MKIGIIGFGYVGKAMYNFFLDKYDVIYYDNNPVISGSTKKEINNCDLGIICVPTPSTENGKCDTSIVEEVIDWLNTPLILIKSTIEYQRPIEAPIIKDETYGQLIINIEGKPDIVVDLVAEENIGNINPILKVFAAIKYLIFGTSLDE